MSRELIFLVTLVSVLNVTGNVSAELVSHWKLDDGSGIVARDATTNGNDGALNGDCKWVAGWLGVALELDGDGDFVDCGTSGTFNATDAVTLAAWVKPDLDFSYPDWSGIIMRGGPNIDTFAFYYNGPNQQLGFKTTGTTPSWTATPATGLFDGEWHHTCAVYDGAVKTVYLDGEAIHTVNSTGLIETSDGRLLLGAGRDMNPPTHYLAGMIDDARVYNEALPQDQIKVIMEGSGALELAYGPDPGDGDILAATWAKLSWNAGDFAASHDVYISDNFDEVNEGLPEALAGNQTDNTLIVGFPGYPVPGGLIPGTTYYWRIDEVNEADPNSPWIGDVWSFSIPPKTAYAPDPADGAEFVDLNATLTWTKGFGAVYSTFYIGNNFDDVSNAAGGTMLVPPEHSPGPLEPEKVYYWRVDEFDGAELHKGDVWAFTTPGAVGNPEPVNGAVDVQMNTVLSWTAADNAASHELYFGTDAEAVRNATTASPEYVGPKVLGAVSHDPGGLDWAGSYAWRVDEVYPTGTIKGLVWTFTTADFILVDDFEAYNDIDPPDPASNTIYSNWIDGYQIPTNGAITAEEFPPYAEQKVVHSGGQSMKYQYDTNLKICESTLTLIYPKDWTEGGVTKLSLWFRGDSANTAERMFIALNGAAVVYHDDPGAAQKSAWTKWEIDLSRFADQGVNLTNVNTITIGFGTKNVPSTGGSGKVYFDDIRLYLPEAGN